MGGREGLQPLSPASQRRHCSLRKVAPQSDSVGHQGSVWRARGFDTKGLDLGFHYVFLGLSSHLCNKHSKCPQRLLGRVNKMARNKPPRNRPRPCLCLEGTCPTAAHLLTLCTFHLQVVLLVIFSDHLLGPLCLRWWGFPLSTTEDMGSPKQFQ